VQLAAQGAAMVAGTQVMVKCATGGSPVAQQVSCYWDFGAYNDCVAQSQILRQVVAVLQA
jgi:hypothetical protein